MEIYQPPKIIFPHIMKTGGTTVNNYLQGYFAEEEVLFDASTPEELDGTSFETLRQAKFVRGHFNHTITEYFGPHNGFDIIGLLRHPVQRVHSHYWHLMRAPEIDPSFLFIRERGLTFEEFIDTPNCAFFASNYQVRMYGTPDHSNREAVPDEASLRIAKNYIDRCCVVGVTEELDAFIASLADYFGLAATPPVLSKNRSYASKTQMSDELVAAIERMNALDMELYEHTLKKIAETKITPKPKLYPVAIGQDGFARWNVTQPFSGNGWGDLQRDEPRHRWSTNSVSTLDVARGYSGKMLGFVSIARFVASKQSDKLTLFINGEKAKLRRVEAPDQKGHRFAFEVPPSPEKNMELRFELDPMMSFSQVDKNSKDTTPLGLALMGIGFDPLT